MCHIIFVGTNCPDDMAQFNDESLPFRMQRETSPSEFFEFGPDLSHVWSASRWGGCSCHFRTYHWVNEPFAFGPPEDWMQDEPDDLAATRHLYRCLTSLLKDGWRVELFCSQEDSPVPLRKLTVNLTTVSELDFLMNEGDHLILCLDE
jgi:hypothetical protein